MIVTAIVVALGTLGVGLGLAYLLRLLPTVRLQLAGLAVLAVVLPLAAVLLSGWVMFQMGDDKKILAVMAISALTAIVAALVVARSIADAIDRVRHASSELAGGDLTSRAPQQGPAEVAQLAASFNEMGENLSRLFDSRRELVAWASHDLRTPLANMQAMLEALEDGLGQPDEYVPALREQVTVLSQLVDDLFELARIDAGALTLELRELPIEPVVSSSPRGVEAEARLRGVQLASSFDGSARARFAPVEVERVLMNLLTNALRHTPTDGAVAVRVETHRQEVQVAVEDTGEGLDHEVRALCSSGSGGETGRAPRGAPAWGSRSRAASWRPTAAASGRRIARRAAPGSASRSPRADGRRASLAGSAARDGGRA